MAAPATHIILAKKIYEKYCSDKDEADFIRGTSFADIRYLTKMDRNLTHFPTVTIEEIIFSDSFTAGLKTHSLIDLSRAKFVREAGMLEILPQSKYIGQTVKCYEDHLLHNKLTAAQWQHYITFFEQLSDAELTFNISKDIIHIWHKSIINSIRQPSKQNLINFLKYVGLPDADEEVNKIYPQLEKLEKIKEIISSYYENFEDIIEREYKN